MHQCTGMLLAISLVILGQIPCSASNIIDSLEVEVKAAKADTHLVSLFNELAYEWLSINEEEALRYAVQAHRLAQSIGFSSGKATADMRLGAIAMLAGDYTEADSFYREALKLRLAEKDTIGAANVYNNLGLLQYYQDNDRKAINFYLDGLNYLQNQSSSDIEAKLYNNLGASYQYLGNYEEAFKAVQNSITVREELGNESSNAGSFLNLGNWYGELNNNTKAIDYYQSALSLYTASQDSNGLAKTYMNLGLSFLELSQYDLAVRYLDSALNLQSYLETIDVIAILQSKGLIYQGLNQSDSALIFFRKGLKQLDQNLYPTLAASLHYNIGYLLKETNKYGKALSYLENCEAILDTLEAPALLLLLTQELAETYAALGKTELALKKSRFHNLLQDSLDNQYREAINYKFSFEEEQKKTTLLAAEKELQVAENKRQRLIILSLIIGGVLWILSSVAMIIAYLNRRKRLVAEEEMVVAYREIENLFKEKQLQTTYAKLEGQDEERKRIAKDLHDRVGSILSTIMLYLKGFDKKLSNIQEEGKEQIVKTNALLDKAVNEVRKIAQNIHSGTLAKFGLKAELEALAEILQESNHIQVKTSIFGLENRISTALEIGIYRIIQELISNVLKHAQANNLTIQVNRFEDVINVLVQDDGKGFDPQLVLQDTRMGLKNIKSRVYNLHGSVIIDSGKGNGTTVTIDIPLEKE